MVKAMILKFSVYYGIWIISLLFFGVIFLINVKLARWEFFKGKQQEWARVHEEAINKVCHWINFAICIAIIIVMVPFILDTPAVVSKHYKEISGVVTSAPGWYKGEDNIKLDDGKALCVVNVQGLKEGDSIDALYLPHTKFTTITKVNGLALEKYFE